MFKKKQQRKNFRRREDSSEHEDDGNNVSNDNQQQQVIKIPLICDDEPTDVRQKFVERKAEKKKRSDGLGNKHPSSQTKILSFGDEEDEEEVFQVKKPSHSKRHVKKLKEKQKNELNKKEDKNEPDANSQVSAVGVYSAKGLAELKKENMILNGQVAETMAMEQEDKDEEEEEEPVRTFSAGYIPDATAIHAARKRRQMARERGDYIPLDTTQRVEKESSSRLVRDDDNDRSDQDDDEERMSFAVVGKSQKQRMQEAMETIGVDSGSEHENDEELTRWEQEQIRKGISGPQLQTGPDNGQPTAYNQPYGDQPGSSGYGNSAYYGDGGGGGVRGRLDQPPSAPAGVPFVPPHNLPSITLEQVKKRLEDRLEMLEQEHRVHQRETDKMLDDLVNSQATSDQLESSSGDFSARYTFFQQSRNYINNLVGCMNEKMPKIEALETRLLNMWKQQARKMSQRRQDDVKDQSEDLMSRAGLPFAPSQLTSGGKERSATEAGYKQRRVADREARRSRRKRQRQTDGVDGSHLEGLSSDDEVTQSEIMKYKSEKELLMKEAEAVFEDVIEEFSTFQPIMSHFQTWKFNYSESYKEAYIGLCLPKLFTPLVRLQLIDWNPLQADCQDFESMDWFDVLLFYGYREGDALERSDPDTKLIPNIVDKVILTKLKNLVGCVWDPLSTGQTRRLVQLVHRLAASYPTVGADNKNTQALLKSIVDRMRKTLDEDVYMPLFPKSILGSKTSQAFLFLQRQFWTYIKLLDNFLKWNGIISKETLLELSIDGLLNRYLILALQNTDVNDENLAKCQKIISLLPADWFSGLEGSSTVRQLETLCRYLAFAASSFHSSTLAASDLEKRQARDQIRKVILMLRDIHALDHASNICHDYNLTDMLDSATS